MSAQYGAISRLLLPKGNGDGVKELMVPRNEITPFVFTLK
jgi:hypothetical protein